MPNANGGTQLSYPVTLVVPCYNEAKRLDVARFRTFLSMPGPAGLLFVDDGSTDGTMGVLESVRSGFEDRVHIYKCAKNGGKGEAVRLGMLYAIRELDPRVAGFWDADLATPLETVGRFLAILDTQPHVEMIFGSRVKLLGRSVQRKEFRHYLGRVFATVVSHMLRLPIYDTQCGAKLFRVSPALNDVLSEPFLSKWVFDVEIIARFLRLSERNSQSLAASIYEYPLETWTDVDGSKVRPGDFFTALLDVARIRRKYLSTAAKTPA